MEWIVLFEDVNDIERVERATQSKEKVTQTQTSLDRSVEQETRRDFSALA